MGMQINTNVAALNSYRNLNNTQNDLSKSLEKLSSGFRINRAADDAAGLAISEGLKAQVGGISVASRNAQDGISLIQTAEGALSEVHSILGRINDLSVQAANDTNNDESRSAIKTEIGSLTKELTRISESTNFNGINLLDGKVSADEDGKLTFQVGADTGPASQIEVNLSGADISAVASTLQTVVDGFADEGTAAEWNDFIGDVSSQITDVSTARADLGAVQNRFESTVRSLAVSKENLSAANSRIRDVDMAEEMVNFTRSQILSQAGTAMLAQANQSNAGVLSLLG